MLKFKELPDRSYTYYESTDQMLSVILFDYEYGYNQIYVRYDHDIDFVEIDGGMRSACGMKCIYKGHDFREADVHADIRIHTDNENAILIRGRGEYISSFFFLNKIEEPIADLQYLPLPDDIYTVNDCLANESISVLIVYPKYHHHTDNYRCFIFTETESIEAKIDEMETYRDGGTTYYDISIADEKYKVYSPTMFDEKAIPTITYSSGKVVMLERCNNEFQKELCDEINIKLI